MPNFIAIDLQVYKIFKIMRVSFFWHTLYNSVFFTGQFSVFNIGKARSGKIILRTALQTARVWIYLEQDAPTDAKCNNVKTLL